MTTLRYTGNGPTTFSDLRIGMVEPGDVFGVPDDQAEAYTRRADIEVVEGAGATPDAITEPEGAPEPQDEAPAPEHGATADPGETLEVPASN
jgi:hypothetical protein